MEIKLKKKTGINNCADELLVGWIGWLISSN